MTSTVFVTSDLPPPGIEPLQAAGLRVSQCTSEPRPGRAELEEGLGDADALLCLLTDRIDGALLDCAPRLKVVANLAVGYDNVDLGAAAARGIVVTNTPDVLTEATADLTWALILAAARRVVEGDRLVRDGRWIGWRPDQLLGSAVAGRTLGILGMGAIGCAVARRASGFGMQVWYHNRHRSPHESELGARYVSVDELFAGADILTLHAPLNAESRHVIGASAFDRMKPSAILVNTARGPLVDERALVEALRAGRLAAAALDVYEDEPELTEGLAELDNVVLLPHLGSATRPARAAMVDLCCRNIIAVLSGEPPITPVPTGA